MEPGEAAVGGAERACALAGGSDVNYQAMMVSALITRGRRCMFEAGRWCLLGGWKKTRKEQVQRRVRSKAAAVN